MTLQRDCMPFAFYKYDSNCLDGKISVFSDRFLSNFKDSGKIKKPAVVIENYSPRQAIILGNSTPSQGTFSDFTSGTSSYVRRPNISLGRCLKIYGGAY